MKIVALLSAYSTMGQTTISCCRIFWDTVKSREEQEDQRSNGGYLNVARHFALDDIHLDTHCANTFRK